MNKLNIDILNNFTENNIPNLDVAVLGALELFDTETIPKVDISNYNRPIVIGSGNAEATGRIIFENTGAVFASESNYQEKIKNILGIDGAFVISASGGKHAPGIVKYLNEVGLPVTLMTNTHGSLAGAEIKEDLKNIEYIFPKNREPYTYNTSTYMGMILGATKENPKKIYEFLEKIVAKVSFPDFSTFDKYYLIVPPEFSGIIRMLNVKFIELFGRNIARDIETSEYVQHATTVAPAKELFISFGKENTEWGNSDNRLHIPLPEAAGYVAMMAIGYYTIAQIQRVHPQYFKENIEEYLVGVSKIFNQTLSVIVE